VSQPLAQQAHPSVQPVGCAAGVAARSRLCACLVTGFCAISATLPLPMATKTEIAMPAGDNGAITHVPAAASVRVPASALSDVAGPHSTQG
jgi:hypothetical protein